MASGEALGAVAGLIDRSLVLRADTSIAARPLYQMLETVRAYAALELGAAGERDEVMEAVARYCLREASLAVEGMAGPAQIEWLDRVHDELDCYRGALAWLIERARAAEASAIASGLMAFWLMRGHLSEGLQWYQQTLQLPSLSPADESRALLGAAVMSYSRKELERAEALATRAVAVARRADDHAVVLIADNLLGHVDHAVGRLESARDRFTRTIEMFRQLAISWGTGNALGGMAGVVLTTGDVDRAERLLVEATAALQHTGPWFLTPVMNLRAIAAVRRGSPDEAIALVRENLTRIRELQDAFAFVYALVALAAAAALKGDDMWAARILGAGDAVTDRTGAAVVDTSVQEIREQTAQLVRARLGLERGGRANAAGRVTSIDSLIKDIDAVLAIRRRA
jgi:tetratricopeptide (TPR) repeat protein